ncbi:MAG TPA: DNA polymerase III subunit delta [Longimicrobiales bacterium]|nr:DNA polymerase III subunit delta [Longimicrobiales bacterium]
MLKGSPAAAILESEGLGGVFYLHGDDEFRKEEAARALVEAHLDPVAADFNFSRMRGSELDLDDLASTVATPPMMGPWRVIELRETEALASSSRARGLLVDVAESPPPDMALILLCSVPEGSRARFYRDLAAHARDLEFPAVSPNDVPGWLMERGRELYDIEIEPDAARALGAAVGTDLGVLSQELEKLAGFVGEGGTVGTAEVEAAGTRLPRQDRWRWFDLVGERRFDEALSSLDTLLGQGETGVGLVIGLATHLLRLGVTAERGLRGLEEALPGNQKWLARKLGSGIRAQAGRWTVEGLAEALDGLLRVDRLLKSSGLPDAALLEEWLLTRMARADREAA